MSRMPGMGAPDRAARCLQAGDRWPALSPDAHAARHQAVAKVGGYIRLDKDLQDDPRVLVLADGMVEEWQALIGFKVDRESARWSAWHASACNAVVGGLYRLWRYADSHLVRGDTLKLALPGLSVVTGLSVTTLRRFPRDWLRERPDGTVELPDYIAKNALIDKDLRREKNRERVRKHRRKHRAAAEAERNASVSPSTITHALPPEPVPDPGPDPYPPKPGPDPAQAKNRETQAPTRAPLASGKSHLAARARVVVKTEPELIADSRRLASTGIAIGDIARMLGQYGATVEKVLAWTSQPEQQPA